MYVRADNEEVEVETVVFTIAGATGLANTVVNATLLLDGAEIGATGTNANSDITDTTITFEDLEGLVLPETTSELALRLNTANIGEDFVGVVQTGLTITGVSMADATGVDSGKDLAPGDIAAFTTDTPTDLDIVTAIVTPTVASTFGTDDQTAELRLVVDGGDNTKANGDAVQADLIGLTFEVSSFTDNVAVTETITLFNSNGDNVGSVDISAGDGTYTIGTDSAGTVVSAFTDSIGNEDETYRLETNGEAIIRLAKDGVVYDVDGTDLSTKLENTLEVGQYADSN